MEATNGIYVMSCSTTGDVFVGSDTSVEQKMKENLEMLSLGLHDNISLQDLANIYGMEAIVTNFVCECLPEDFENQIEDAIVYIKAKRI